MDSIVILLGAFFLYLVQAYLEERRIARYERRIDALQSMHRSMANRLTAKELGGYIALQAHDKAMDQAQQPRPQASRDDSFEEELERLRIQNIE
jgi:hypothetical protein